MVRDRRLLHGQGGFEVADTDITRTPREEIQDLHADRVGEDRQVVGEPLHRFVV